MRSRSCHNETVIPSEAEGSSPVHTFAFLAHDRSLGFARDDEFDQFLNRVCIS